MDRPDFLVIGAGIVGIAIALELQTRRPDARVRVLEKERVAGAHASGRNSGVLHAGFYYSPDSLKARLTRLGNRRLQAYCDEKKIPVLRCGKLVLAKSERELKALDLLVQRAQANQVPLERISDVEARSIEPRVRPFGGVALWSPTTASVDPLRVLEALWADARQRGIRVDIGTAYQGYRLGTVLTSQGPVSPGFVFNAAGLQADEVARDFGFSKAHRILPFKGTYLYSSRPKGELRCHVYPVPDLKNPFLGVHFTLTHDGRVKIGPTAIPAFWREQYQGLSGFRFGEMAELLARQAGLFVHAGFDFRALAVREIKKYWRPHLVSTAAQLVEDVHVADYETHGRPGIRAQLLDVRTRQLVMDFVLEGDSRSMHVLNAVSPGFTSALSFAELVVDRAAV